MSWTRSLPPAEIGVVPIPSSDGPPSRRQRTLRITALVVALVLLVVGLGYGLTKYFRMSAIDDYYAGYGYGSALTDEGADAGSCRPTMERRYGDPAASSRYAGWGEFLFGCLDGAQGRDAVAWHDLRDRMFGGD